MRDRLTRTFDSIGDLIAANLGVGFAPDDGTVIVDPWADGKGARCQPADHGFMPDDAGVRHLDDADGRHLSLVGDRQHWDLRCQLGGRTLWILSRRPGRVLLRMGREPWPTHAVRVAGDLHAWPDHHDGDPVASVAFFPGAFSSTPEGATLLHLDADDLDALHAVLNEADLLDVEDLPAVADPETPRDYSGAPYGDVAGEIAEAEDAALAAALADTVTLPGDLYEDLVDLASRVAKLSADRMGVAAIRDDARRLEERAHGADPMGEWHGRNR